jgi:hypothetical protein
METRPTRGTFVNHPFLNVTDFAVLSFERAFEPSARLCGPSETTQSDRRIEDFPDLYAILKFANKAEWKRVNLPVRDWTYLNGRCRLPRSEFRFECQLQTKKTSKPADGRGHQ